MSRLDLGSLPPLTASKFINSLLGLIIDCVEIKGNIVVVNDEKCVKDKLLAYLNSKDFDTAIRQLTARRICSPIDGFLAFTGLKSKLQDFIRNVIERGNISKMLEELTYFNVALNRSDQLGFWGSEKSSIKLKLTPHIFVGSEFVEGVRLWPARQLIITKSGRREKVAQGLVRDFVVSDEVYALIAIGFLHSFITRYNEMYVLAFPLDLTNRDFLKRFTSYGESESLRSKLGDLFGGIDITKLPESALLFTTLASAAYFGFKSGGFEISVHKCEGDRRFHCEFKLTVWLDEYAPLIEAIGYVGGRRIIDALRSFIRSVSRESNDKCWDVARDIINDIIASNTSLDYAYFAIHKAITRIDRSLGTCASPESEAFLNMLHKLLIQLSRRIGDVSIGDVSL